MQGVILFLAILLTPGFARASSNIDLDSQVFVERAVSDESGAQHIVLDQSDRVTPGDNLVFVLRYRNNGERAASNFNVINPLPRAVSFRETQGQDARFSVDGGKNWGSLSRLSVRERDGHVRRARPDDVTHIRWTFRQPLPAGATGKLSFRGSVR